MPLLRLPDWEDRLRQFLTDYQFKAFQWGVNDCALFAASAVHAMTGVDPAAAYRGQYDDEDGARLALREHGKGTLFRTLISLFGRPIHPAQAQRGDIMLTDNRKTAGVCVGQYSFFVGESSGQDGLVTRQTTQCHYAFRLEYGGEDPDTIVDRVDG